jgi:hypothetical protein
MDLPPLRLLLSVRSQLLMYGLKGTCAYAHHAELLGGKDPAVYAGIQVRDSAVLLQWRFPGHSLVPCHVPVQRTAVQ